MATAVVCCSGVGQTKFVSDGMGELYDKVRLLPDVTAFLRRKWHDEIQMATILAHEHDFDRIILAGHSRGGRWCADVACQLQEFGNAVAAMFFADAWSPSGSITVPASVVYLESWLQSNERKPIERIPHGVKIYTSVMTRHVAHEAAKEYSHNQLDSHPDFHAAVMKAATT